jgi:hypothetical protein
VTGLRGKSNVVREKWHTILVSANKPSVGAVIT